MTNYFPHNIQTKTLCVIIICVWFFSLLPGLFSTMKTIVNRYYYYGNKTIEDREKILDSELKIIPLYRVTREIIKKQANGNY